LRIVVLRVITIDVADGPASDRLGISLLQFRAANSRWWRGVFDAGYQGVRGASPGIVSCRLLYAIAASTSGVPPGAVIMPASEFVIGARDKAVTGSRVVCRVAAANVANGPAVLGLNSGLVELAAARALSNPRLARRCIAFDADDQGMRSPRPASVSCRLLHVVLASIWRVSIRATVMPAAKVLGASGHELVAWRVVVRRVTAIDQAHRPSRDRLVRGRLEKITAC
jgi:hypothetical protein